MRRSGERFDLGDQRGGSGGLSCCGGGITSGDRGIGGAEVGFRLVEPGLGGCRVGALEQSALGTGIGDVRSGLVTQMADGDRLLGGIQQGGSDELTVNASLAAVGPKAVTADGYLSLGKVTFTSGVNNGLSRTVKTQGGGVIALVRALPAVPQPGDTFVAYPGWDLTQSTCDAKFGNLAHFKGYPFVPTAETAAP